MGFGHHTDAIDDFIAEVDLIAMRITFARYNIEARAQLLTRIQAALTFTPSTPAAQAAHETLQAWVKLLQLDQVEAPRHLPGPLGEAVAAILLQVRDERAHQVAKGFDIAHDDSHSGLVLVTMASFFTARAIDVPDLTWLHDDEPPPARGARHDLIRAAALLVAAIERLDRSVARAAGLPTPCYEPAPAPFLFAPAFVNAIVRDVAGALWCCVATADGAAEGPAVPHPCDGGTHDAPGQ